MGPSSRSNKRIHRRRRSQIRSRRRTRGTAAPIGIRGRAGATTAAAAAQCGSRSSRTRAPQAPRFRKRRCAFGVNEASDFVVLRTDGDAARFCPALLRHRRASDCALASSECSCVIAEHDASRAVPCAWSCAPASSGDDAARAVPHADAGGCAHAAFLGRFRPRWSCDQNFASRPAMMSLGFRNAQ